MIKACHVKITGRVQGVGYRAWTVATAAKMGMKGWVRNRKDGSVEAMFHGTEEQIELMLDACHKGPMFAKVEKVISKFVDERPDSDGFVNLPTL